MSDYNLGDLVCFKWPGHKRPLRIGIITLNAKESFNIKWFWYNKSFYLEDEFDEAAELSKKLILGIVEYLKKNDNICIEILSN